jgi:hypothetical protein
VRIPFGRDGVGTASANLACDVSVKKGWAEPRCGTRGGTQT